MQKFEFLWKPLLGELAMSRKREEEKKDIYSGHLCLGAIQFVFMFKLDFQAGRVVLL